MIKLPENLDECIELLLERTSNEEKEEFVKNKGDGYHFGFGRWMRNNWGLWDETSSLHQWFKTQGVWHADDMSGIILTSFYRHLIKEDRKLEEQIQFYKEYWAKNSAEKKDQSEVHMMGLGIRLRP